MSLVSAGHRFEDVKEYTIEQIMLFYAAQIKSRLDYMTDIRLAVWGGKEEIGKHIEMISKG